MKKKSKANVISLTFWANVGLLPYSIHESEPQNGPLVSISREPIIGK